MEGFVILVLLVLLGGAGLFVWLISAIASAFGGSTRLRALEGEQAIMKQGLDELHARLSRAEDALREARREVYALLREQPAKRARFADVAEEEEVPEVVPAAARVMPTPMHSVVAEPAPVQVARVPVIIAPTPIVEAAAATQEIEATAPVLAARVIEEEEAAAPVASPLPIVSVSETPSPALAARTIEHEAPLPAQSAARSAEVEPSPEPLSERPAPAFRMDWERWLGVRGAAALGACVLVIAGLYFFKYSMEQGLISPTLRVLLGALAGLGGLAASERMIRRDYTVLANWLAGAGIAILYIAFWAAHGVYGLIGMPAAFGLMILVTGLCGFLAVRRQAMVIAVLGLLGGFATPVALSSGSDHPIGLFGYLLLLDVALLYLALKRGWPLLAALSLGGTVLYQAGWIGERMRPDSLPLGIAIVLVFSAVFTFTLQRMPNAASRSGLLTRASAFVLPFVFGLYFGLRSDLGQHLYPIGGMLIVLSVGALFIARQSGAAWISVGGAVGSVSVLGAWLLRHDAAPIAWEVTGLVALLALVFHGAFELELRKPAGERRWTARAAAIATFGALLLLAGTVTSPAGHDPWPWLAGLLGLSALALRHAGLPGRSQLRLGVAIALNVTFPLMNAAHEGEIGFPAPLVQWLAIAVVSALGLHACWQIRKTAVLDSAPALPIHETIVTTDGAIVLLPFGLALYLGLHGDAGAHLWPLGLMVIALTAASSRFALGPARQPLGLITALGSVTVLGLWTLSHDPAPAALEIIGLFSLLAALLHASLEAVRRSEGDEQTASASVQAAASSLGALLVLLGVAVSTTTRDPWPWLAGVAFAAALTLRHAGFVGRGFLHLAVALPLALGLLLLHLAHLGAPLALGADLQLALALGVAFALQIVAQLRKDEPSKRWASHAAAAAALVLLFDTLVDPSGATPRFALLGMIGLATTALISAARLGQGIWMPVTALITALIQTIWAYNHVPERPVGAYASELSTLTLAGLGVTVALFTLFPLVGGKPFQRNPWAWRSAALAGSVWFAGLHHVWTATLGQGQIGLLPVGLAALAALAGLIAMRAVPREESAYRTALVWLFSVPVVLVTCAVPLQLENEQITIAWALEGLALIYAWKRLDHPAVKYAGLGLLGVATARLVLNPFVLDYHSRAATPVLNWLLPTYGVPALALAAAWYLLSPLEVPRLRLWEGEPRPGRLPYAARVMASSAIVVVFAWINLTILDAFGTGASLQLFVERMPARDLSLSLAWAVYALALLAVGMARGAASLRWCSLALIIVTLGKVFLYDLAHLHDLYRVGSLVGLAFSLILISLAYQRFVFAKAERPA